MVYDIIDIDISRLSIVYSHWGGLNQLTNNWGGHTVNTSPTRVPKMKNTMHIARFLEF